MRKMRTDSSVGFVLLVLIFCSLALSDPAAGGAPDSPEDGIVVLKANAGEESLGISALSDVNNDTRIGLAEAIHALRASVGDETVYGEIHQGMYHLGPVDFAETEWHNACAPAGGYRQELQDATGLGGEYLAGVSSEYNRGGGCCDTCILIKTALDHEIVARVVTYGDTGIEDIDVSPTVYAAINEGEWPRTMTWQYVKCPYTGPVQIEYKTGSNIWWTALWVRNARIPIEKVEVQSTNHSSFYQMTVISDGSYQDSGGFGAGQFTIRITAIDGQVIEQTFPSFQAGELVDAGIQFE